MTKPRHPQRPFPTKDEILAFVRESPDAVGKREIARAFRIRGSERGQLRNLLKELQQDGQIGRFASGKAKAPRKRKATSTKAKTASKRKTTSGKSGAKKASASTSAAG